MMETNPLIEYVSISPIAEENDKIHSLNGRLSALIREGLTHHKLGTSNNNHDSPTCGSILPKLVLSKSDEFVFNSRGERLHVRSTWPTDENAIRGVILSLHGYCAHINRPAHSLLSESLVGQGWVYVTVDFHGHGYSDGEHRAFVADPMHLVDDALSVILAIFEGEWEDDSEREALNKRHFSLSQRIIRRECVEKKPLPLYLMGQSMGGGTAFLAAQILQGLIAEGERDGSNNVPFLTGKERLHLKHIAQTHFHGVILFSPLLQLPSFGSKVANVFSLYLSLVSSIGQDSHTHTLPSWVIDENEDKGLSTIWSCPLYRDYIASLDTLSYKGNTRFGTLVSLNELTNIAQKHITGSGEGERVSIEYPVLILHDPKDAIVDYAGSEALFERVRNGGKKMIVIENGGHDVIVNALSISVECVCNWLDEREEERKKEG